MNHRYGEIEENRPYSYLHIYLFFFYSVETEMSTESDVVRSTEVKRSKNCLQGASDLVV